MAKLQRSRLAVLLADKLEAIDVDLQAFSQEVAAYLLTQGRSGELDSLMRDIMQVRADRGTVEVIAHTAYPLSDNVRADIQSQIKGMVPSAQTVVISEVHDPSVVAGVRLELANQQLDLSVRAKLNRFKQLTTA